MGLQDRRQRQVRILPRRRHGRWRADRQRNRFGRDGLDLQRHDRNPDVPVRKPRGLGHRHERVDSDHLQRTRHQDNAQQACTRDFGKLPVALCRVEQLHADACGGKHDRVHPQPRRGDSLPLWLAVYCGNRGAGGFVAHDKRRGNAYGERRHLGRGHRLARNWMRERWLDPDRRWLHLCAGRHPQQAGWRRRRNRRRQPRRSRLHPRHGRICRCQGRQWSLRHRVGQ